LLLLCLEICIVIVKMVVAVTKETEKKVSAVVAALVELTKALMEARRSSLLEFKINVPNLSLLLLFGL